MTFSHLRGGKVRAPVRLGEARKRPDTHGCVSIPLQAPERGE